MVLLLIELAVILAKIVIIIGIVLGLVSYSVLAERKISAMIQERVGPNRVAIPFINFGGCLGLGQPLADAMKFLFKEEFTPKSVNTFYFWLAPTLAMMPPLITLAAIPFGSVIQFTNPLTGALFSTKAVIADVNVGILLIFAITSLSVYGIVLAGWSSNSKYPFLGGIRSSAQLISYELAMGLSVVPVFLIIGDLNLGKIIQYQMEHGWLMLPFFAETWRWQSFVFWIPMALSFWIFLISAFAETNRLPFDMPESETELVGGYHTEYSAMKFALFFLGEYAAMMVAACLMVTLFFGGWSLPGFGFSLVPSGESGLIWGILNIVTFLAKMMGFIVFFIWIRWTLPRFRYDQLMRLGWKVLLPVALANVIFTAFLVALLPKI
jgi:NADH-quinone oxidoreductase subunit H